MALGRRSNTSLINSTSLSSETFELPKEWNDRLVRIEFDGVFMNSEAWINGHYLGKRPYGYISFHYDITKYLNPGPNTIAVRVDSHLEPAARWYHGCGIYGHVRLVSTLPTHIPKDGIFVQTPKVSAKAAQALVQTELCHAGTGSVQAELTSTILDPSAQKVASHTQHTTLKSDEVIPVSQTLTIPEPKRWAPETPNLYQLVNEVSVEGKVTDRITTRFASGEADSE